jgi:hypothetical protein
MNDRIRELAAQAGFQYIQDEGIGWAGNYNASLPKFAKLIVKECVGLCDQAAEENAKTFYTVTETKEVGPALVAKGSQVQAEKLSKQIKQHFGVE